MKVSPSLLNRLALALASFNALMNEASLCNHSTYFKITRLLPTQFARVVRGIPTPRTTRIGSGVFDRTQSLENFISVGTKVSVFKLLATYNLFVFFKSVTKPSQSISIIDTSITPLECAMKILKKNGSR